MPKSQKVERLENAISLKIDSSLVIKARESQISHVTPGETSILYSPYHNNTGGIPFLAFFGLKFKV